MPRGDREGEGAYSLILDIIIIIIIILMVMRSVNVLSAARIEFEGVGRAAAGVAFMHES